MTSQTPPYPYFNGITYNPSFFSSSSSTTGNYLNYPIAQGTETISTLYTSTIDSSTPSSAITLFGSQTANLTMATGITGGTIRLGPYTTGSIHIGNIDHQNNVINNASAPAAGSLGLGTLQTTGVLSIGTNTSRSGNINIGNGAGSTGSILIGTTTNTTTMNGLLLTQSGYLSGRSITLTYDTAILPFTLPITTNNIFMVTLTGSTPAGILTIPAGYYIGTKMFIKNVASCDVTISLQVILYQSTTITPSYLNLSLGGSFEGYYNGAYWIQTSMSKTAQDFTTLNLLTASGGITSSTGNFTTGGNITASTGGKMLSAYYDALADTTAGTTALRIGNNVVLGDIEIGNAQTTGDIKIGLSDASGALITIGTASTATTINGSLAITKQLTAPTTLATPSSTQLGYVNDATNGHTSVGTVSVNLASLSSIPIGSYMFWISYACDTWSIATMNLTLSLTYTNASGTPNILLLAVGPSTSTGGYICASMPGIIDFSGVGTIQLKGITSAGTVNCKNTIKILRVG